MTKHYKGVAGLGSSKPAASVESATRDAHGESGAHTLNDLVKEGKDFATSVLSTAQGYAVVLSYLRQRHSNSVLTWVTQSFGRSVGQDEGS